MNDELLALIERELLDWPGVSKEMHGGGFRVPPATVYRFGRRQIGHIHDTGVADLTFPRAVHDELISDGLAEPHRGGFPAVVSYYIRDRKSTRLNSSHANHSYAVFCLKKILCLLFTQ